MDVFTPPPPKRSPQPPSPATPKLVLGSGPAVSLLPLSRVAEIFFPFLAFETLHQCCKFRFGDKERAFLLLPGITSCQPPPPESLHPQAASCSVSLLCYPVPKYCVQSTPPTVRPPQEEAPSAPHSPNWHEGILYCSSTFEALQVIDLSHAKDQILQYCATPSYLEIVQHTVHTPDGSLIAKTAISCSPPDLNKFFPN